jgi:hypothetical protein
MRTLCLVLLSTLSLAAAPAAEELTVTVAPFEKDRRWVLVEYDAKGKELPGSDVVDERGAAQSGQRTAKGLAWFVPVIPAGQKLKFAIKKVQGSAPAPGLRWSESGSGVTSLKLGDKEITRYNTGAAAEKQKHHKPFFWPLNAHGVNLFRGWPVEPKQGDTTDHPHHTGMYFAFGEVNGKDYWAKEPFTQKQLKMDAGPAFAELRAENAWGEDLVESDEVRILTDGNDVVADWTITLSAVNGPVTFAKDLKQAKEGAFVCRLSQQLSLAKGDAPEIIVDAKGGKGEKAAREGAAPWVDYSGTVDGKKVGLAIMNHPTSWRYPSDWHVRAYGLFAANPWIIKGENTLQKGESLTFKWRVYTHEGDAAAGKVADVFAGYANVQAVAE